jgi:hypothetical protein
MADEVNGMHAMTADTGYRDNKRHQYIYSTADYKSGAKSNE